MILGVDFSMKSKRVIEDKSGGIIYLGWISAKVWNAMDPRKMISAEKYNGSNFLRTINNNTQMNLMTKTTIVSSKKINIQGNESLKYRSHKEADAPYRNIFSHLHRTIFPKFSGILMTEKRGLFCSAIIASFARGVMLPHSGPARVAMNPAYKGTRWLLAISRDSEDCDLIKRSIPTAKKIDIAKKISNAFEMGNRNERIINPASRRQAITIDEGRMERPKVRNIIPKINFLFVKKTAPAMIRQILGTSELMIGDQADRAIPIKRKMIGEYLLFRGNTTDKSRKEPRLMSIAARKEGNPSLSSGAYNTGSIPPLM